MTRHERITPMEDRAFDVKSLAEKWQCSTDAIYDMIDAGVLRWFTIGRPDKQGAKRKGIRISAKEVARCEGEREQENPPTPQAAGHSAGTAKAMPRRLLRSAARLQSANG